MLMSANEAGALDKFVEAGGVLIASGMTAGFDARGDRSAAVPLACFPLQSYEAPVRVNGWTLDPAKSEVKVTGRVPIDGFYFGGVLKPGAKNLMPFAPDQRFGPPELSFALPDVNRALLDFMLLFGKGFAVHIPWFIDWQYYRDGLPVHQQLIAALISRFSPPQICTLEGTGPVELMAMRRGDSGPMLLHVVNYAGQRNGLYAPAPRLHDLRIGIAGHSQFKARALVSGQPLQTIQRANDPDRTCLHFRPWVRSKPSWWKAEEPQPHETARRDPLTLSSRRIRTGEIDRLIFGHVEY